MPVAHPQFRAAAEAAGAGAKPIAFPETWLPGDPWFIWLDSPAWGMQCIQRHHDISLVAGSPQAARLAQAARDHQTMVVMGHSEKAGGSLCMGQWIIGADGATVAMRCKLKPTQVERTVFGEGDGSDPAGHHPRPDVTRLLLDKTPRARVVLRPTASASAAEAL